MSRRGDIDRHLDALADIGKIMRSMKNLSYMETRKLVRFLSSQRRVVDGIDAAAQDFLSHYPDLIDEAPEQATLWVLIGAERGFCGSFNQALLARIDQESDGMSSRSVRLIPVGSKLGMLLEDDPRVVAKLPGPSAAEDVPAVLNRLVQTLNRLIADQEGLSLTVQHWDAERDEIRIVPVLPPFPSDGRRRRPAHPFPPGLNLVPPAFLGALVEHSLFAALHYLFFSSLMAEHQQRVRHLEGALQRVDERVRELRLRRNVLRQEEITEEIELILLNLLP
ncbi:MAG: F0F1 ATP synthase subunit gamma [Thiocapsa sp.]|jgi:F-type H+-transporting ATPase subunit gamma|nr:F0F1 ATP synthase subunit gamma [Thiocapsa sp.]MCG6986393.1 F0F1 ATP synthase subunit gamma [Thiocapsa sp.]